MHSRAGGRVPSWALVVLCGLGILFFLGMNYALSKDVGAAKKPREVCATFERALALGNPNVWTGESIEKLSSRFAMASTAAEALIGQESGGGARFNARAWSLDLSEVGQDKAGLVGLTTGGRITPQTAGEIGGATYWFHEAQIVSRAKGC